MASSKTQSSADPKLAPEEALLIHRGSPHSRQPFIVCHMLLTLTHLA